MKTRLIKNTANFTTKKWKFSDKNSEAVLTSTRNLFLSRNKKNNIYPCKPVWRYKSGI